MTSDSITYVIGDVHGYYDRLVALLRGAGFVGDAVEWTGGGRTLVFMGDFTDRGPDGIAVIELVMRLQWEARAAGGEVLALLGNHELMFVFAARFGDWIMPEGMIFHDFWRKIAGGKQADIDALRPEHLSWMMDLPAMALIGDRLFMHADGLFYTEYGRSVAEVNATFRALLHSDNINSLDRLAEQFSERFVFTDQEPGGAARAAQFLSIYGGRQLVHGHSPIAIMTGKPWEEITIPLVYADGLCINVDPGLYKGGPGFVAALPLLDGGHGTGGRGQETA